MPAPVKLFQLFKLKGLTMQTVYRFSLIDDCTEFTVMTTEVDELDPRADGEFWARFLEGDCLMVYLGEFQGE